METTVSGIGELLMAALKSAGYKPSTMLEYRKWLRRLELLARKQDGKYTEELGAEFASMTMSPRTGQFSDQRRKSYGRLVRVLDSYIFDRCAGSLHHAPRRRHARPAVRGIHPLDGRLVR
ncbi:hypothetical protein ACTXI0_13955 [Arthrobacter rhombi]|uniref:hypothetical protein n=1 Tax=Arthrobacter rhombi TaxID=71253 RepID=UPI003FD4A18F